MSKCTVASDCDAPAKRPRAPRKPRAAAPKPPPITAPAPQAEPESRPVDKPPAPKRTPSKPKVTGKKPTKNSAEKKDGQKKPAWRYTTHREERYRFRELDGEFVVEGQKDGKWGRATAAAAQAIHKKSESVCAIAARILPTCGANTKKKRRAPTEAEKQAMRQFIGL